MRTPESGREAIGFHAENLQVARLDEQAWQAIADPETGSPEALSEIRQWNAERDPETQDREPERDVRYLSINVAQLCNLRCAYCAAGGDGTFGDAQKQIDLEKAYAQLRRFIAPLPPGARFVLNFLGGEPLVALDAIEAIIARARLLAAGKQIKFVHKLTTNATLIDAAAAERLARAGFHVQVSLDGPPAINDRSRVTANGRSSTAAALRGANRLFDTADRLGSISVNAVHGAHNVDALATYGYLREFPWDRISLSFDSSSSDEALSLDFARSFCEAADAAWAHGGERELRRLHDFDVIFDVLDTQRRNRNFCGAGKSQILMDASARLYACYWWAGDAREDLSSADGGIDEAKRAQFARALVEANDCGSCWARNVCGGGCMNANKLANGNKHRKSAAFCDRTRRIVAKGVELYERSRSYKTETDSRQKGS